MQKNFDEWNERKKHIHDVGEQKRFHEREIWWCVFGVNVGREQDGRGDNFERPIVIVRKLSGDTFIAVPLTTKRRLRKFQADIAHSGVCGLALLDQVRVLDAKRLLRKIGLANKEEFEYMKNKFKGLL